MRILHGQPIALEPDAAFVSLLFAHLIAGVMAVLGPSFFAARLVSALAALLAVVAGYAVPRSLGSARAGLAVAAVLAVHPWAVFYGRIASVPYTLGLLVMTAGPLLFVAGLRRRLIGLVAAGVLVLSLGAHFSPLTVIAPLACVLFALVHAEHRWVFRHWLVYACAALGALHALPVVIAATRVAQQAAPVDESGAFWPRLGGFLHMVGTGLGGEATLRHFTSAALPAWPALVTAIPVVALLGVSVSPRRRDAAVLGGFGSFYLLVSLVVMPLVLAPGRNWYLPANHMDRYLFAVLPAFAFCVGEVAAAGRGARLLVGGFLVWLLLGCTGRAAYAYLGQGGVDHGELIFDGGGGYRGWLVSEEPRATMLQIRDTVLREVGHGGAAILVADRVFIPLQFAMEGTGVEVHDVRRIAIPPRPDGRYFVVLFPDGVLSVGSPPTANPKYVASNRKLRERMQRLFEQVRLVRTLRQRGGAPLLEIWRAEKPRPRLVDPSLRREE